MRLGVVSWVYCTKVITLYVSPGLDWWLGRGRMRSRGWVGDAELHGDFSGFLRSRGTNVLG